MFLTVTLNPSLDEIFFIKNLNVKSVSYINRSVVFAGGKGINVARAIKILGSKVLATGLLGGDRGEYLDRLLDKEKIKHKFYYIEKETRRNFTIIEKKGYCETHLVDKGPFVNKSEYLKFKRFFTRLLKNKKIVVFSGSICEGMPPSAYKDLIALSKKSKIKTVLDTRGKPLSLGIKAIPDVLKLNRQELEGFCGYKISSAGVRNKIIRFLIKKGIKSIIITDGSRDIIAADEDGCYLIGTPKIKCTNSVGSGDAFLAGLVMKINDGWELKKAVKFAAACGAANALTEQPGFFLMKDVKRLLSINSR
jgi:tagatose 6-phosphate kinase